MNDELSSVPYGGMPVNAVHSVYLACKTTDRGGNQSMNKLEAFDNLVGFAIEHGGTLINHRQFHQMASDVRRMIEPELPLDIPSEVCYTGQVIRTLSA